MAANFVGGNGAPFTSSSTAFDETLPEPPSASWKSPLEYADAKLQQLQDRVRDEGNEILQAFNGNPSEMDEIRFGLSEASVALADNANRMAYAFQQFHRSLVELRNIRSSNVPVPIEPCLDLSYWWLCMARAHWLIHRPLKNQQIEVHLRSERVSFLGRTNSGWIRVLRDVVLEITSLPSLTKCMRNLKTDGLLPTVPNHKDDIRPDDNLFPPYKVAEYDAELHRRLDFRELEPPKTVQPADGEFDNVRIDVLRRCVPARWSESPVWRASLERVRERFVEAARKPGGLVCLLENDSVGLSEPKTVAEFDSETVDHPPRRARLELPGLRGLTAGADSLILRHPGPLNGVYSPGISRDYEFHGDFERWQEYSAIATAAGSCLTGLPKHVTALVWRDWLNGFDLPSDVWLWTNAVFELAWRQIPGSSLKAERFADVLGCQIPLDTIPQLRANVADGKSSSSPEVARELAALPDSPLRWYSLLDDVLNASIAAIDLLFAIAGQPVLAIRQNGETSPPNPPPKKVGRKRDKGDKATEACEVWIAYESSGLSQQAFCDWWNGDKKVARVGLKWLDAKLSFVRKLMRADRVPDEFTNKLKPLRRVKSITKNKVKNSRHSH